MQTTFLDKADLERLAADFNALLHDYPEWRREMYEEMAQAVLEDVNPRDSWRASKGFRLHLAQELTRRALRKSTELAGGAL